LQADQKKREEVAYQLYNSELILEQDFSVIGSPYFGFDPDCLTLFIKSVPRDCPREDLLDQFSKLEGNTALIRLR